MATVDSTPQVIQVPFDAILEGDCLEVMREWPSNCVDHCITDPPFNMSRKKGLGWAFSSHVTMQETWDIFSSDEYLRFTGDWIEEVSRVVKPNGNIFIFGSYHNIYIVGFTIQQLNLRVVNSIIWFKPNAQPNITARMLTESTEQLVWVCNNTVDKAKNWVFNYGEAKKIGNGRQLRNMWELPYAPAREKKFGKNPAQKPESILERLITIGTREDEVILDCFAGTGTTGVVADRLNRHWVMIEKDSTYVEISRHRLSAQREGWAEDVGIAEMSEECPTRTSQPAQPRLLESKTKYHAGQGHAGRR